MRIADLGRAIKARTFEPCRLASAVTRVEAMALGQHTIAAIADVFHDLAFARANHCIDHDAADDDGVHHHCLLTAACWGTLG